MRREIEQAIALLEKKDPKALDAALDLLQGSLQESTYGKQVTYRELMTSLLIPAMRPRGNPLCVP